MTYQPFLIANFSTGVDRSLQPWLTADDSWESLYDGYVYRGITNKRDGYSGFATGKNTTACESRMVHKVSNVAMTGAIDTVNKTYTTTGTTPIRRGTFVVKSSVPNQTVTDDGKGGFTGDIDPMGTNTIDYSTGNVTVTFLAAPTGGTVTATYDYHPGNPVMGVMNFWNAANDRKLVVADTQYVNVYNNSTDRLDDISPASAYTGAYSNTVANFWSWTNYADAEDNPRLLFVNNSNRIQQYDGTDVTTYIAGVESATVTAEGVATGDGTASYSFTTANFPIRNLQNYLSPPYTGFTITDTVGVQTITDNGDGTLGGDGSGNVDYLTGQIDITFNNPVGGGNPIVMTYQYYTQDIQTCLHIFEFKDRLIALRTTENGQVYGRRIRISGFGQNCDVWLQNAPGAGVIDLPDQSWIVGAAFNRDDLVIFTERSTWVLKYTGSDTVPFVPERIAESRGSDAPFSSLTYLNRTITASTRGMIVSDGYKVERMDDKIPYFTMNTVYDQEFFKCFMGFIDEDRDAYLIFPTNASGADNQVLVINMEEDNFAFYRIPLTCMGNYYSTTTSVKWSDLTADNGFPDWDALAAQYSTWAAFPVTAKAPVAIGGGPNGEVWSLNTDQAEDNPVRIRGITNSTVTTDFHNYKTGDTVFLTGMTGASEWDNVQATITKIDNYSFTFNSTITASAYTSGGLAVRVIPFEAKSKKFNPWVDQVQKVRTGWMYFYLEVCENVVTNIENSQLDVGVITNDRFAAYPKQYKVSMENAPDITNLRRWQKIWINQVGDFLQFELKNTQALAKVKIHAMMPGFQPQGPMR